MVQLGWVRMQILLPNLSTAGKESRSGNEQKVENNDTYFYNSKWLEKQ